MLKSVKTVQRRVKKFLSQNKWSSLVTRGEIPEKMQANVHTYMVMKQIWKVARSGFRFSPKKSVGFVFFFRNDLKRNRNQNNYRSICRSISRKKQINRQYLERGSVCMCVWHRCAFYVTQRDTIIIYGVKWASCRPCVCCTTHGTGRNTPHTSWYVTDVLIIRIK